MKLNPSDIEKIVKGKKKGFSSSFIGSQFNISKRRVNQLFSEYNKTGNYQVLSIQGRKQTRVYTKNLERKVLSSYNNLRYGANYIA